MQILIIVSFLFCLLEYSTWHSVKFQCFVRKTMSDDSTMTKCCCVVFFSPHNTQPNFIQCFLFNVTKCFQAEIASEPNQMLNNINWTFEICVCPNNHTFGMEWCRWFIKTIPLCWDAETMSVLFYSVILCFTRKSSPPVSHYLPSASSASYLGPPPPLTRGRATCQSEFYLAKWITGPISDRSAQPVNCWQKLKANAISAGV